jgi:hypothetical protein
LNALPKPISLGTQFGVRELLHLGLKLVDSPNLRHERLDDTLVLCAENLA